MALPSDEQLMRAVQEGRLELLGVLFERYHARAFGLCMQMVHDTSIAEDLVQDAFVRVLRYRDRFSEPGSFGAWLYRIVRNVCLDDLKARDRESEALARVESLNALSDPVVAWSRAGPERIDAVRRALAELPEEQRTVLVLKRVHGLTYREIASRCGGTEGAMRVRAHRALQRLRELVDVTRCEGDHHDM